MKSFIQMPVPIQMALSTAGFKKPTAIQEEAIPLVVEGRDLIGIAQTGTGKTAAYLLPLLQRMFADQKKGIRALILCPTRELAIQVAESVETFARHTPLRYVAVYGGVPQGQQVKALRRGVDLLVATPGRLLDLQQQGHVNLERVEFFVLDEADRMLDMGFINDIKKISRSLPRKRQTLFFSATMSGDIEHLARELLDNPVRVEVALQMPVEKIEQRLLFVDRKKKIDLLLHLLNNPSLRKVLIFTKTKRGADKLCRIMKKQRISVQQIHGDRTQGQRTRALRAFAAGQARCLVATDVAARGIDIDDISHVINYDLPMEPENYIHRIGRTARAGAEGTAYSFCTSEDKALLNAIERSITKAVPVMQHPFHSESAQRSAPVKKMRYARSSRNVSAPAHGSSRRGFPKNGSARKRKSVRGRKSGAGSDAKQKRRRGGSRGANSSSSKQAGAARRSGAERRTL